MSIAVQAIWEKGVLTSETRLDLPEKTKVRIIVEARLPAEEDLAGWNAIDRLIGMANDERGPTDVAEKHVEYLYGNLRPR